MKIRRHKKVTKFLNFYCNNFGFRKPYQFLIDGTFCFLALKNKVNIKEQLQGYIDSDIKLLTTKCIIHETEILGHKVHGAMVVVKQFSVHQCGHDSKPLPGSLCLRSMIGNANPNRYIIATQDRELQDAARSVPGTPVLYLHNKTPTLEAPSKESIKAAQERTSARFQITKFDEENITKMKKEIGLRRAKFSGPKEKKKGGPNPLSCKKSKKKKEIDAPKNDGAKKRNRRRLRIPEHVIAELLKEKQ